MDIYKAWEQLDKQNISYPLDKNLILTAIHRESNSVISELKKRLKAKLNWVLFFLTGFLIGMIYCYSNPQALLLISLVALVYLIGYLFLYKEYKKMNHEINMEDQIIRNMKFNESRIKKALEYENNIFIFTLPIIILAASFFKDVYAGASILECFNNIHLLKKAILFIIIGLPAAFFSGKAMNDFAYGKFLKQLRSNIEQLESEE